ncbi:hypothetical protein PGB90_000148 [Kerria lacca]
MYSVNDGSLKATYFTSSPYSFYTSNFSETKAADNIVSPEKKLKKVFTSSYPKVKLNKANEHSRRNVMSR